MNPFAESDLAELREKYPDCDVDRVAERCTQRHAKTGLRNPLSMLRSWVLSAERRGTDRLGEETPDDTPVGMFRADGSWDHRGHGDPAMHRFVDMLVTARRRDYSVARIAERIMREPGWQVAFPNAETWLTAGLWQLCPASTAAEQCVIARGQIPVREPELPRSDPTYAAFRFAVIERIEAEHLTPAQTAELLAEHHSKFAHLPHDGFTTVGDLLDAEIASYRAMGERW